MDSINLTLRDLWKAHNNFLFLSRAQRLKRFLRAEEEVGIQKEEEIKKVSEPRERKGQQ